MMNKAELRVRWEEYVSIKDKEVLDAIWKDLEESGDVEYARNVPETGLEDLVLDTENRLKYWRLGRGQKKPMGPGTAVESRRQGDTSLVPNKEFGRLGGSESALISFSRKASSSIPKPRS